MKRWNLLGLSLMTGSAVLMACSGSAPGVALDWRETNTAVAPSPTAIPAASPTQRPMPMVESSATPNTAEPVATTTAQSLALPRDEKGRVIGGEAFPVVNYSPTLIAGKPCPRVSRWEFVVVKLQAPLRSYGVSKDPCVVQNAVDDLARTLFFYPPMQTPETMREVDKVYDSDPMNVNGVEKTLRASWIEAYRNGEGVYHRCDKPVVRLIVADARAPLIANNDGNVSGQAIQLIVLRATLDVSPFACEFVAYKDGAVKGGSAVTAENMRQPFGVQVHVYNLLWNAAAKRWQVYFVDTVAVVEDYLLTVTKSFN
jgi:hypothetical protein